MDWTDISDIKGGRIEQAKVEAQRRIAEELEKLNKTLDTGFGLIIDELTATPKEKKKDHVGYKTF